MRSMHTRQVIRKPALWALLCAIIVAATGCGASGTAKPAGASAPVATTTGTEKPIASVVPRTRQGAFAAPKPNNLVPVDQVAINFDLWYRYEVLVPPDSTRSADDAYQAGTYACNLLLQNNDPPTVVQQLEAVSGYHGVGAQAVVKASLSTLCPSVNHGYKTDFDKNVDLFQSGVLRQVTFNGTPPDVFQYGFFMKSVCDVAAEPHQPNELYNYLRTGEGGWLYLAQIGNASQPIVMKIFVNQAVLSGCPALFDLLAAYWGTP